LSKIYKNMEARCMKCKGPKMMKDEKEVEMKRKGGKVGRAMTGVCPDCGTKMFRILPAQK